MISTKIKDLRIKNDITQEQLSKELSVAKSTIGMWENGRREPDIDMIKKIAKYFKCPVRKNRFIYSERKRLHKRSRG